jgi:hypothetical protein
MCTSVRRFSADASYYSEAVDARQRGIDNQYGGRAPCDDLLQRGVAVTDEHDVEGERFGDETFERSATG